MLPIETESTNLLLLPPHGQEDRVFTLPCTKIQKVADLDAMLAYWYVQSCWQMTWRERWRILRHGQVWFSVCGETHPPIKLEVRDEKESCRVPYRDRRRVMKRAASNTGEKK